uniref:Uncharacterized protein n=1 Tax=Ditylenchus dipsaci TaxID=166011 RepID=A0A915DJU4_9BILA
MEEQRKNNYLNKHRQTQAQIDKCVADTKEKHQKEMAEYKEEVREKHFQEMSTLKEELPISPVLQRNISQRVNQDQTRIEQHHRASKTGGTVYQRQLAVNEQSYLQINEEHQKELSESRKQLDKLRQEFITVNAEHAKELENTRTKADEVIHKLERDLTETKTGMTDALENLAKVREESAEASARHLKELEVARKEADKAIQKVQQISETLARKREMEVLVLEFKAKSSTAQKDITELKRKSREMADKLESTYIAKNKLKFDLESKLAAVTEKYQNATEQNLSIEKESAFPPVVNKQHQNLASSAIPDTPNNTKNQILADHPAPTSTESNIVIRTPDTPVLGSTFATCLTPPAKHSRSNKLKRMSCTPSQSPEKMTKAPRNDKGDKKEEEKVSKAVPEQEKDNDCEIVYVATKKKSSQISSSYLGLNLEIRPL